MLLPPVLLLPVTSPPFRATPYFKTLPSKKLVLVLPPVAEAALVNIVKIKIGGKFFYLIEKLRYP